VSHPIRPLDVLAECCVCGKQSPGPFLCGHLAMAPLLPKLRGQFAEFLKHGSLARLSIFYPSTCVGLRYGRRSWLFLAAFLSAGIAINPDCLTAASPSLLRRGRNIGMCLLPISYASRPRLRGRLTRSRRTELRKPWTFGAGDSHPRYRYSCLHRLFHHLHTTSRLCFAGNGMLPYRPLLGPRLR
jgi:hypothetical protein